MRRRASQKSRPTAVGPDHVSAPDGVLEFMRMIWGISHGLQSTSKRMEARLGITGPQRLVVRILGYHPGATAGELARALLLHPSTLTGILRRLEDHGLILRSQGEHDRRQARFRLTAAGRAVDRRNAGTVEAAVRRVLAGLPASKIESAAGVLRALEGELAGGAGQVARAAQHPSTGRS